MREMKPIFITERTERLPNGNKYLSYEVKSGKVHLFDYSGRVSLDKVYNLIRITLEMFNAKGIDSLISRATLIREGTA